MRVMGVGVRRPTTVTRTRVHVYVESGARTPTGRTRTVIDRGARACPSYAAATQTNVTRGVRACVRVCFPPGTKPIANVLYSRRVVCELRLPDPSDRHRNARVSTCARSCAAASLPVGPRWLGGGRGVPRSPVAAASRLLFRAPAPSANKGTRPTTDHGTWRSLRVSLLSCARVCVTREIRRRPSPDNSLALDNRVVPAARPPNTCYGPQTRVF